jgi:hypothetical protein
MNKPITIGIIDYKKHVELELLKTLQRLATSPAMIGGTAMGKSGNYTRQITESMQYQNVGVRI